MKLFIFLLLSLFVVMAMPQEHEASFDFDVGIEHQDYTQPLSFNAEKTNPTVNVVLLNWLRPIEYVRIYGLSKTEDIGEKSAIKATNLQDKTISDYFLSFGLSRSC